MKDDEWGSLDDWKPAPKKMIFRAPSEWRKAQNQRQCGAPSLDDVQKIKAHLRSWTPKKEIMETFGISSYTLKLIMRNRYLPYDTNYASLSQEKKVEVKQRIAEDFQEMMDEIRIEYNLSETMFNVLFFDMLGVKKKKKKEEKNDQNEEVEIKNDALKDEDESDGGFESIA